MLFRHFKMWCARRDITIREAIIQYMEEKAKEEGYDEKKEED